MRLWFRWDSPGFALAGLTNAVEIGVGGFAGCMRLINEGKDIDCDGASGPLESPMRASRARRPA
jgi:hypothetical protein